MLEKEIESRILNFLQACGLMVWKNNSIGVFDAEKKSFRRPSKFHRNGVSDILGCLPNGRFLAIEVKSKIGRPSPNQLEFITEVQKNGGICFISRSVTQTYNQLVSLYPALDKFEYLALEWKKLEEKENHVSEPTTSKKPKNKTRNHH
jgi:penicillin-binding protein-related factor A (putative recombinase)